MGGNRVPCRTVWASVATAEDDLSLPINRPEYSRKRAEEARALAEMLDDPEAKSIMLSVVEGYERLAKHAEERPSKK